jgi:hypothetical protein
LSGIGLQGGCGDCAFFVRHGGVVSHTGMLTIAT